MTGGWFGKNRPTEHVAAKDIRVDYHKAIVELEDDIDAYLAKVKKSYLKVIMGNKSIAL
jgi:hypothetical protein